MAKYIQIWLCTFLCFSLFKFAYLTHVSDLKYDESDKKQPGVVTTKNLLKNNQKLTKTFVHDYGYEISGANYSLDVEIYAHLYLGYFLLPQTERPCFTFFTRISSKGCTESINLDIAKSYPTIRRKFSKRRTVYYTNTPATYNNEVLQLSGDVHSNPGPVTQVVTKLGTSECNLSNESRISTIISSPRIKISTNFRRQICPANLIYVRPELMTRSTVGRSVRNISLAHLNVRSIKNRINFIQVNELVADNDWDVFTASETWLNSTVSNAEINIAGYKLIRSDRRYKRGGGDCAYIRNNLKAEEVKHLSSSSEHGFQQLWVRIQHIKLKSFLLCVVYRPPDCEINCFKEHMTSSIIEALLYDKTIIIMGDLNCDLLSDKSDTRVLKELCTTLNLSQIISKPTRVTNDSVSLLDVVLTTNPQQVINTAVLESTISDHFTVTATIRLKAPKPKPFQIRSRSFKFYDPKAFNDDLAKISWNASENCADINIRLEQFNKAFLAVLDSHAPVKLMSLKHRASPFISPEIKDQMKVRDTYLRNARRTRCNTDWALFKRTQIEVKKMITEAEKRFVDQEIMQNKNNSHAIWKTIRRYTSNKQRESIKTANPKILANEFNSYFASLGNSISESVMALAYEHHVPAIDFEPLKHYPESEQFFLSQITREELVSVVRNMPTNKSPGIDKVTVKVIKDCLSIVSEPLTDVINLSLSSNIFPTTWKIAEVVPHVRWGW